MNIYINEVEFVQIMDALQLYKENLQTKYSAKTNPHIRTVEAIGDKLLAKHSPIKPLYNLHLVS